MNAIFKKVRFLTCLFFTAPVHVLLKSSGWHPPFSFVVVGFEFIFFQDLTNFLQVVCFRFSNAIKFYQINPKMSKYCLLPRFGTRRFYAFFFSKTDFNSLLGSPCKLSTAQRKRISTSFLYRLESSQILISIALHWVPPRLLRQYENLAPFRSQMMQLDAKADVIKCSHFIFISIVDIIHPFDFFFGFQKYIDDDTVYFLCRK